MRPYQLPANFLFSEPAGWWASDLFPNAKLWGDASAGKEEFAGFYCVSCERDHQTWLVEHNDDE
jgi:hypothetical protein